MATLLSTDKLESSGPTRQNQFRVERFQTDNYTIRAATGFNNATVKYSLVWNCLTQAEANALADQLDATNGVDLLQWTPPFENEELNFTVSEYNVTMDKPSGGTYQYRISATLNKEYDIT